MVWWELIGVMVVVSVFVEFNSFSDLVLVGVILVLLEGEGVAVWDLGPVATAGGATGLR